jgi:lipopolysaccharide transport protein LptA
VNPLYRLVQILLLAAIPAVHSTAAARGPLDDKSQVAIEARSTDLDLKSDTAVLHHVKMSRLDFSISADTATVQLSNISKVLENGRSVFQGNVLIIGPQGKITSRDADMVVKDKLVTEINAHGDPVEFELVVPAEHKQIKGHAESVRYEAASGCVRFLNNAWISDGQNEIKGQSLRYYMANRQLLADPGEQEGQQVHITITPNGQAKP